MVRLWRLDLRSDDWTEARVLAPDAIAAGEALLSYVAWVHKDFGDPPTLEVRAVVEVDLGSAGVVELHMRDPGVHGTGASEDRHKLWKVTYRDGLHHHPEGAALVVAESASEARALVEAADPFEERPFYGVPAVYDRAERSYPSTRTSCPEWPRRRRHSMPLSRWQGRSDRTASRFSSGRGAGADA